MKKLYYFSISILLLFFLFPITKAQSSKPTILCIAAHPDDEDGATLAYYSLIKGYNAFTVYFTRGEGGQNETGPELYEELGKIREKECMEAAGIIGSKPYFLGYLDFGYSKTASETFKFWGGKDSVLARIVYMIRLIRPEVVISNHDTITSKPNRQHGNHQAAGITIFEAFVKAADPGFHPEQFANGVEPWQVKKLYFRISESAGGQNLTAIDINRTAPNGKTLSETSFESLSKHRTQGMDKLTLENSPGIFKKRYYLLVRSDKDYPYDPDDLFSGIAVPDKSDIGITIKSFPTKYFYRVVNPDDSIRLLKELKLNDLAYIGVIKTYDNTVEEILGTFGVKFDTLSSSLIESGMLSKYSVIVIDLRGYFYRTELTEYNNRLLEYVSNGGNVICFYQKPQDWNGKDFAPYPLYVTSERVTEEDAPVTVLEPEDWLFNRPNKIQSSDWLGWVQERNIYLPSGDTALTSARYHRLLEMCDENDPVPSTSLLWAEYGAGTYTYCSLALYRQLKIFNEGGLKLFLNMISQPRREVKGKYN